MNSEWFKLKTTNKMNWKKLYTYKQVQNIQRIFQEFAQGKKRNRLQPSNTALGCGTIQSTWPFSWSYYDSQELEQRQGGPAFHEVIYTIDTPTISPSS